MGSCVTGTEAKGLQRRNECIALDVVPAWAPVELRRYIEHVEAGRSLRAIAREAGCHASTIMRQIRRYEMRRDDLLVDLALRRLGRHHTARARGNLCEDDMTTAELTKELPSEAELRNQAPRILRRMNETGACLAIAQNMDKAVVVRDGPDGQAIRTCVVDSPMAEALAIKDWIAISSEGRITRYRITQAGRMALKRFIAEDEASRAQAEHNPFGDQHREMKTRSEKDGKGNRRIRYNVAESPLLALARRTDKDGKPFLAADLVAAGERLREDFELAQLGPRVTQNWDRFLTAGGRGDFAPSAGEGGSDAARKRVADALTDLGPGLADVVLRCCCFLEGMEAVERRMGWSARSGKIVLRIALTRLKAHYNGDGSTWSPLIG